MSRSDYILYYMAWFGIALSVVLVVALAAIYILGSGIETSLYVRALIVVPLILWFCIRLIRSAKKIRTEE